MSRTPLSQQRGGHGPDGDARFPIVPPEPGQTTCGGFAWADLAEAADANFVTHASWAARHTPGMTVLDSAELVIADSGLPCDTFNFVCRARLSVEQAEAKARKAIAYFRRARRPFSWWVGPADRPSELGDILVGTGLRRDETELAMAADLSQLRLFDLSPNGLSIRRVRSRGQLEDFARLNAANWDPPDPDVLRFYQRTADVLLSPESPLWFYVGYLGDDAVATSELTLDGGAVGLYNISTLPAYRRRGIGTAMTLQPLVDVAAQGGRVGILQAAADGVGVYARVGFQCFGNITEYKPPADFIR